jgi:hypothetical protein
MGFVDIAGSGVSGGNDLVLPIDCSVDLVGEFRGYAPELDIETRTVDIHIAKLRRKLEADPSQPRHLLTVRGGGYRLLTGG